MTRLSKENHRIEIADEQFADEQFADEQFADGQIVDGQTHRFDGEKLIAAVRLILTEQEIKESEISIALVDDPTIRKHNNQYLGHDYETDVISFLLEYDPSRSFLSGQLIVSTDTAISVSSELGIPMAHELLLYVVHGTLHLVGYDDTTPQLAAEMRSAEKFFLRQMGVEYHGIDESEDVHESDRWLEPNSFDSSVRDSSIRDEEEQ